jgi:hypothetical protein
VDTHIPDPGLAWYGGMAWCGLGLGAGVC